MRTLASSAALVIHGAAARQHARRSLAPHLAMAAVFEELLATLSAIPDLSLAVRGSVATDTVDEFSDLDLETTGLTPPGLPTIG